MQQILDFLFGVEIIPIQFSQTFNTEIYWVSLAKSFGIKVESRLIWSVGNNTLFAVLLMSLFGCMIASAVAVRGKTILESYRRILKTSGIGGTDYLKDEGGATTVFNMGVNGLFATLFVLAVKGFALYCCRLLSQDRKSVV